MKTSVANPTVIPMIAYEKAGEAADWLCRAFGFRERDGARLTDANGNVGHTTLDAGDGGVIMLATPSPEYRSPNHMRELSPEADRALQVPFVVDGVLVYVDDVDAHLETARAAGAKVLSGPVDEPFGRLYRVEDLEGHRWMFMQRP